MKKFFAMLIAVAMVLTLITVPAMAENKGSNPEIAGKAPKTAVRDAANLNEALNVEGGEIEFVSEGYYPWVVSGDAAMSGNGGVGSTESVLTAVVTAEEGDIVQFEFKAWGEGSYTLWDHCDFAIDGSQQFTYGAYDNDWETFAAALTAGSHTLTWSYTKDGSVNPTGDYFMVDNVYVGQPVQAEEIVVQDVSVPAGRRATVHYEVLPAAAFDKSVDFYTDDTSIATVDENGLVTGVAEGETTIFVCSLANPEVIGSATVTVTEALPTVYLYGYDTYDMSGQYDSMWVEFADYDPTNTVTGVGSMPPAWAAAFAGGNVYGYLYDSDNNDYRYFIMDAETYSVAYPGTDATGVNGVLAMSYDYTTDTMYGITGGDVRSLCVINLANGIPEIVSTVSGMNTPLTFAIDGDGVAYAIEYQTGDLYTIDLETAEATLVGSTGVPCAYVQSMCFDYETDQLFWAQISSGDDHGLYVVNTETAEATAMGLIGVQGGEICSLYTKNDIEIAPIEMPDVTVTFIDGVDNSVIDTMTVEAGTVLDEADFPTPPEHEGLEFVGWNYDGAAVYTDITIKARYRDPNATTATIVLSVPSDVWGDGSGYQMLLDEDATAYGTIIPTSGGLTSSGDAPDGVYDEFEYKIPENADGNMSTSNVIVVGEGSIEIPAGVYDWCITNPTPGDRIWIASSNGNIPGRYDDYEFEAGKTYTFTVTLGGSNDRVDLTIEEGGSTPVEPTTPPEEPTNPPVEPGEGIIWDFETDPEAQGFEFIDADGDGYNWEWVYNVDSMVFYEGLGFAVSESYVNYVGALNPDNWMVTPEFQGTEISFWANGQDPDWCDEYIGVYVSEDGGDTWSDELFGTFVTADPTEYVVDLSAYTGTLKVAFRHYNVTDMFRLNVDYIVVTGGETPPSEVIGDVNGDGEVGVEDAIFALRYVMGLIDLDEDALARADVNGDGVVTIDDCILVLRLAMGLITLE